jgi:hypothetical protein
MALWTDIIDPATLTGYARASLADYEARRGSLARWLPNREVADIVVRFVKGRAGLVDVAKFRAYDAEPEIGRRQPVTRVTLELPALGQNIPVSEYEQLRSRGGSVGDAQALLSIQNTTDLVVRAVADSIERLRGIVLLTGKATINQDNFKTDDDFGRPGGHAYTVGTLWSTTSANGLGHLETAADTFRDVNGEDPGALVMSTRVFRALSALDQMKTTLVGGAVRPGTSDQVRSLVTSAGMPDIYLYDRRVSVGGSMVKVLADDRVYVLPAPTDPNDGMGSELGATFWGRTLTSSDPDWGIEDGEQPGIVAGVYKHEKPPMGLEVISDAIGLPVLANAELSMAVKVL